MNTCPSEPSEKAYAAQRAWQSSEAAAAYQRSRSPSAFHRFQHEEEIINYWLDLLPAGALILDIPCGAGRFVNTITDRGFEYLGADISRAMIAEAQAVSTSKLIQGFILADAAHLPLHDGEVHCVIIWRLLHHIRNSAVRLSILHEAARVSRHSVLLSFHHSISFTAVRKVLQRAFLRKGSGTEFTHWRLHREARECGLILRETRGFRKYISINWFAWLTTRNLSARPCLSPICSLPIRSQAHSSG